MILLCCLFLLPGCLGQFVAHLQEDGLFSPNQYLQYRDKIRLDYPAFSVCFRFQLYFMRGETNYIFSVSTKDNPDALNFFLNEDETAKFCLGETCANFSYQENIVRSTWSLLCSAVSVSDVQTRVVVYMNGVEVSKIIQNHNGHDEYKELGILMLGQEQDSFGGGIAIEQSYSGAITQFNMWDSELKPEEIDDIQTCKTNPTGNVVGWTEGRWTVVGNVRTEQNQQLSQLCRKKLSSKVIAVPNPISFPNADTFCNFLSATMLTIGEEGDIYSEIKEEFSQLKDTDCVDGEGELNYWLGNLYRGSTWVDYQNKTPVSSPLTDVRIPRNEEESCLLNQYGSLRPRDCQQGHCAICKLRDSIKPIKLKGVCNLPEIDTTFYPSNIIINDRVYLRGLGSSHIFFNESGVWVIESLLNPEMKLVFPSTSAFPYGRNMWKVAGPASVCKLEPGSQLELTLSSCPLESFTCNTGECIELANKCNSKIECKDGSDEASCTYLKLPPRYSGHLGPRSKGSEPVPVYINISVLAFPQITTVALQFTADYYINLKWYDSRLSFKDLNDNSLLNGVQTQALQTMWSPQLAFLNALGPYQTIVDELSVCTILLEKNPSSDDLTESLEYYGFNGEDNAVNLKREYYQDYACEFDLLYYPFDTQVCHMLFSLQGFTKEFISLRQDHAGVEYLGKRDLLEYQIQDERLFIDNTNEESRAELKIVFRRRIEYHIFGVFIQQKILIAVGFLTYFFEVTNFTDRVMVSLTLMLVIATLSDGIKSTLPATPYLKMIDVWLFVSLNVMVLTLLFHTILLQRVMKESKVEAKMKSERPSSSFMRMAKIADMSDINPEELPRSRRLNNIGRLSYLTITLSFWFVFWVIAFIEFFRPADEYITKTIQ